MSDERILVIRHGALGDILLSMQAFQDIRAAFPSAHITLLTTPAFAAFGRSMPWFNAVIEDKRASWLQFWDVLALGNQLKAGNFTFVFDLQNKPRTTLYKNLFLSKAKWSGAAAGASHPRPDVKPGTHHFDKTMQQIRAAGVNGSGPLKLDWLAGSVSEFHLPPRYAVLVPGCAPHRLYKRWPPQHYAALANQLTEKGFVPVLVGGKDDAEAADLIAKETDVCVDLCGKTSLAQLASLFRGAKLTVGNDTGPTHLSAILGTPTLALIGGEVDPAQSGPRGAKTAFLKESSLANLDVPRVFTKAQKLI
jgi:ADP-heptose:LPS heptosyltransferase